MGDWSHTDSHTGTCHAEILLETVKLEHPMQVYRVHNRTVKQTTVSQAFSSHCVCHTLSQERE